AGFYVEHQKPEEAQWLETGFVEGQGTTSDATSYRFAVEEIRTGTHQFRLRQVDIDGTETLSKTVSVRVIPDDPVEIIVRSSPSANPTATVTPRETGDMRVVLYDILGRQVDVLHQGMVQSGETVSIDLSGQRLSSGTYFLRTRTDQLSTTERVTVVR
ncbi:T9SS type A sorting domain-containing protein, partial [Longibacter sp.]|uniref:T9SS type A sorting domain-containing protein n=1 Tax=Longibacter sp. TaxID=2045415 RepID=UPI003EBA6267